MIVNQTGRLRPHSAGLAWLLPACDAFSAFLSAMLALVLVGPQAGLDISPAYRAAIIIGSLATPVIFAQAGVYRAWRGQSVLAEMRQIALGWLALIVALVVLGAAVQAAETFSRLWLVSWMLIGLMALWLSRVALRQLLAYLREQGLNQRKILIVGYHDTVATVEKVVDGSAWAGLSVAGVVAVSDGGVAHPDSELQHPLLGTVDDLDALVREENVDQVWLAFPLRAEDSIRKCLHVLRHSTVDIKFVPDILGLRLLNHSYSDFAGLPVLNLTESPMTGVRRVLKAVEDRALAALILLFISPFMLAIAAAVKINSSGPALFKQRRHGWDGRTIEVYKFRSMKTHAESTGTVSQATKSDPRITSVGAFLRRTSLDELPQFINVLQGRMSIVGPRPHAVEHNEQYKELIENYMLRHKVKPGITGWAQVNGWRGETDTLEKMQRRIEHDLHYIENWSLWLDLKIIVLTFFKGFIHKNAF